MKKLILIIFAAIIFATDSKAQTANVSSDILDVVKLNSGKEIVTRNLLLNSSEIQKLDIMNRDDVKKRFGSIKEGYVMVVTPKSSVKLVHLSDLYRKRQLNSKAKSLPIMLDGRPVKDTTNLLVDENSIKSFKQGDDSIIITSHNHYNFVEARKKKAN